MGRIGGSPQTKVDAARSDAELLAAHVAGEQFAFAELVHRHQNQLHRLAYLTSRHHADAEDAVQDALLSAHRTASSFRYDCAVSSWLYRIVVNACLDRRRRAKCQPHATPYDELAGDGHLKDPGGDPALRIDTALVVERALLQLPVGQRAAIVAVDMQGYSVAETARLLGIAEGTVKSRCARARAKLAHSLRHFDREEREPAAQTSRIQPVQRP